MKLSYWILIGVVVVIILFLFYNSNKNKQIAQQSAVAAALASSSVGGSLPINGSSQVASIIDSLFPYFGSAVNNGIIGSNKKDEVNPPARN